MDVKWVRIRSWHAVKEQYEGEPAFVDTVCGRVVLRTTALLDDLPAGRSCESCLRIVARKADA